jgi:2-polyprenyl-6-methoxyphenol hydroxylase-like FAD-dependent oxidoreductase
LAPGGCPFGLARDSGAPSRRSAPLIKIFGTGSSRFDRVLTLDKGDLMRNDMRCLQVGSTRETQTVDVAVVGGGVAGASVAAALAAAGLGVAIVEREPRFRDRVRGECIHPWGVREADRLGLLPVLRAAGGNDLPIWQAYADRAPLAPYRWTDDTPEGHVEMGIFHPAMQQALLDHAGRVGAMVLRPARVTAFRGSGRPELDVTTEDGPLTLRARLVVGADGRTSAARRWIGAGTLSDPTHHAIMGGLLDGVDLDPSRTHDAARCGTVALVFPQGGGRVRAYLMCDDERAAEIRAGGPAGFIAAMAAYFPDGAFAGAEVAGPVAVFPNPDVWADRIAGDGVVLVGDAAGASDPSLGHGLSVTLRDARELRDLLLDKRDWDRAIQEFAARRSAYHALVREYARWHVTIHVEAGPDAEARRTRAQRAHEADPSLGGFSRLITHGPDGLVADEAMRRHYFGEDLA